MTPWAARSAPGGRALQGAGAVSAAVTALLADQTRDAVRTKAMALVGASIGLMFAIALVAAPLLAAQIGLAGLFGLTCAMALSGSSNAVRMLSRRIIPLCFIAFILLMSFGVTRWIYYTQHFYNCHGIKNTTFGLSPGSYFMISFKLVQLVEMRGVEPLSENIAI